jgi:hypothetical protein
MARSDDSRSTGGRRTGRAGGRGGSRGRQGARRAEQLQPEEPAADEYIVGPLPDHLERLRERLKRFHS